MKKNYLLLATLMFASYASASVPSDSFVWGYCTESMNEDVVPEGLTALLMLGMPGEITSMFEGDRITSVIIGKGYYQEEEPLVDIIIMKDLFGDPVYVAENQKLTGERNTWVELQLPEPYEIPSGETIYVGYRYKNIHEGNLPIVTDYVPTDDKNAEVIGFEGSYTMTEPDGSVTTVEMERYYMQISDMVGAISLRLRIEGDNIPQYNVSVNSGKAPMFSRTGQEMTVELNLQNKAAQTVNSVAGTWALDGVDKGDFEVENLNIQAGGAADVSISGISVDSEGEHKVSLTVNTINGNADEDMDNNAFAFGILTLDEGNGYPRRVLVEEGTGTWCGNCPRGIVGMEYMKENYPDSFIGVAEHSDDDMEAKSFLYMQTNFFQKMGYPSCVVDRIPSLLIDPSKETLEPAVQQRLAVPSYLSIDLGTPSIVDDEVVFAPQAVSCINSTTPLRWAFILTEDHVGPYMQSNYYADKSRGELEWWDEQGSEVEWYFDEVARYTPECEGFPGSFPPEIDKGITLGIDFSMSLSSLTNIEKSHLIAFVVNDDNGTVINSASFPLAKAMAGIENNNVARQINVVPSKGRINVTGDFSKASVYSLSGINVGNIAPGESLSVAKGVYLVRCQGKTFKVAVF